METLLSQLAPAFLDAAAATLLVLNSDGQLVDVNDLACQRLERPRADLLTMRLSDIAVGYSPAQWQAHWDDLKHHGRLVFEGVHRRAGGETFSVECALLYIVVNTGEYGCCVVREIPERQPRQTVRLQEQGALQAQLEHQARALELAKRELEEERAERQRTDELVRAIIDATSSRTGEAFFGAFARALSQLFRCRYVFVCEHLDRPVTRVQTLAFCDQGELLDNIEYAVASSPCEETAAGALVFYPQHIQQLFPDDHYLVGTDAESYCGIPLFDQTRQLLGHLAILDDRPMEFNLCDHPALSVFINRVTTELVHRRTEIERRRAEDERQRLDLQLRQSEHLASLGTFAAGVAHELNNPLGAIRITAEHARAALASTSEANGVQECLTEILDDAQRCAQIVKRVLHFAQQTDRVKSRVALHPLIRMVELHTRRYVQHHGGQLCLVFAPHQPYILAHEAEIELALVNLIRNAVEASEPGGVVTIETEVAGGEVSVSVQDMGKGLSEGEQQRVFDPFYTTREAAGGTGLGLSIVHRIITDHDGHVRLESIPGKGTTVHVRFPLVAA